MSAKLRAVARTRVGDAVDRATPGVVPGGSALVVGGDAWVLAEDGAGRSLGPALAWALRHGARSLVLVAATDAGSLARRASFFDFPIEVAVADGRSLRTASPQSMPSEPGLDPRAEAFGPAIERAGAEVVIEGGLVLAEVRGLEVARVVAAEPIPGVDEQPPLRLEVGVGKHDREAHQMVGAHDPAERLFDVVRTVLEHRVPGGEGHAAYHLATERWLRWVLVRHPEVVGASRLHVVPSPVWRADLRQPAPAPAAGAAEDGSSLLVVCSAGIDLDLVPAAIDAWQSDGRKPRLVLAVPEGDDHRVTRDIAALASVPAEVVAVRADWRAL